MENSFKVITRRRSGDRVPVGGKTFRTRPDRPWGPSTSYTMDNWSFPGIKQPESGVNNPPPFSAEVKERFKLYVCSPLQPSWQVIG